MPLPHRELGPQGLKPAFLASASATAEQAAEKVLLVDSLTSAAKAGTENKPVIAAIKRCATQNQCNTGFFRSL
jgi:hypothetical protein